MASASADESCVHLCQSFSPWTSDGLRAASRTTARRYQHLLERTRTRTRADLSAETRGDADVVRCLCCELNGLRERDALLVVERFEAGDGVVVRCAGCVAAGLDGRVALADVVRERERAGVGVQRVEQQREVVERVPKMLDLVQPLFPLIVPQHWRTLPIEEPAMCFDVQTSWWSVVTVSCRSLKG